LTVPFVKTANATHELTAPQVRALRYGARGNAFAMPGHNAGGAKARMIDRLIKRGLLTDAYPRITTAEGDAVLAAIDAKKGR
jgi:hypothetical protein